LSGLIRRWQARRRSIRKVQQKPAGSAGGYGPFHGGAYERRIGVGIVIAAVIKRMTVSLVVSFAVKGIGNGFLSRFRLVARMPPPSIGRSLGQDDAECNSDDRGKLFHYRSSAEVLPGSPSAGAAKFRMACPRSFPQSCLRSEERHQSG